MNIEVLFKLLPEQLRARLKAAGVHDDPSLVQALQADDQLDNDFREYFEAHQEEISLATIIASLPESIQQELQAAGVEDLQALKQAVQDLPHLKEALENAQQTFVPPVLDEILSQLLFAGLPPQFHDQLEQAGVHDEASFEQAIEDNPELGAAIMQFEQQQALVYHIFIEFAFAPDELYLDELVEEQQLLVTDEFIEFVQIVISELREHDDPEGPQLAQDIQLQLELLQSISN